MEKFKARNAVENLLFDEVLPDSIHDFDEKLNSDTVKQTLKYKITNKNKSGISVKEYLEKLVRETIEPLDRIYIRNFYCTYREEENNLYCVYVRFLFPEKKIYTVSVCIDIKKDYTKK